MYINDIGLSAQVCKYVCVSYIFINVGKMRALEVSKGLYTMSNITSVSFLNRGSSII